MLPGSFEFAASRLTLPTCLSAAPHRGKLRPIVRPITNDRELNHGALQDAPANSAPLKIYGSEARHFATPLIPVKLDLCNFAQT